MITIVPVANSHRYLINTLMINAHPQRLKVSIDRAPRDSCGLLSVRVLSTNITSHTMFLFLTQIYKISLITENEPFISIPFLKYLSKRLYSPFQESGVFAVLFLCSVLNIRWCVSHGTWWITWWTSDAGLAESYKPACSGENGTLVYGEPEGNGLVCGTKRTLSGL